MGVVPVHRPQGGKRAFHGVGIFGADFVKIFLDFAGGLSIVPPFSRIVVECGASTERREKHEGWRIFE